MDRCTETVKQMLTFYPYEGVPRSVEEFVTFVRENHEALLHIVYAKNSKLAAATDDQRRNAETASSAAVCDNDEVDEGSDSVIYYPVPDDRLRYLTLEQFKNKLPGMTEKDYLYAHQKQFSPLPSDKLILTQLFSYSIE